MTKLFAGGAMLLLVLSRPLPALAGTWFMASGQMCQPISGSLSYFLNEASMSDSTGDMVCPLQRQASSNALSYDTTVADAGEVYLTDNCTASDCATRCIFREVNWDFSTHSGTTKFTCNMDGGCTSNSSPTSSGHTTLQFTASQMPNSGNTLYPMTVVVECLSSGTDSNTTAVWGYHIRTP